MICVRVGEFVLLFPQFFGKVCDGIACDAHGLFHAAVKVSAAGVEVSATIEEFLCHLCHGEVIDGAQAHPYAVVLAVVLAQGDGHFHAFNSQRLVDESFCVALDEAEVLHVLSRDGEV